MSAGSSRRPGEAVQIELVPSVRSIADDVLELDAETTIDQRQLGMTYSRFGLRAPATVSVHAVLRRA